MRKFKKMISAVVLSAMLSLSIAGAVSAKVISSDHGRYEGGIKDGYVYSQYYDSDYRWYRASVQADYYVQDTISITDKRYGGYAYASMKERWWATDYSWYDFGGGKK